MTAANPKASPNEIVATLRDMTVTFDGYQTRSLTRVSLDVRRGEVLGVLGAKGAGKSTVLKILAGRVSPTEGTARVFGRSPRRSSTKARVGYLPNAADADKPGGFFGRLFGKKGASPQSSRGVSRFTQAVLGNRDLLILDEPFAGLGPAEMAEAKALIQELASRGKTVVVSSDALMDIKDLCHRLAIFHEGKIQAIGTLRELLAVGGAIRFFPAVMPRQAVDRVLKVLREQILDEPLAFQNAASTGGESASKASCDAQEVQISSPNVDEQLTALTKGAESAPNDAGTGDSINHEKLKELTKSNKQEI